MQKDIVTFVKTDFLKHEKEFNLMRDFVLNLNLENVKCFDEFNCDLENDRIIHTHIPFHDYSNCVYICNQLEKGYIAISLYELKQFFS